MTATLRVADKIDAQVQSEQYWEAETSERLLSALDSDLVAAVRAGMAPESRQHIRALLLDMHPAMNLYEPRPVVRLFDEPEAHLHPGAQRRSAGTLESLRLSEGNLVIASHSTAFLDLVNKDGWSVVHVEAIQGTAHVGVVERSERPVQTRLARQLGVSHGELFASVRSLLIVEGEHDALVLERLYGQDLRAAGVAITRMYGTNNLLSVAEMDFITRYLDAPLTVLVDYIRADRFREGKAVMEEEKKLRELHRRCRRRGVAMSFVGLERPDIVCYLSEAAVREHYPSFPGWKAVLQRFEARRSRPPFKTWLLEQFSVDLTNAARIGEVLETMAAGGHQPAGELAQKVRELLADADQDHPEDPQGQP